MRQVGALRKEGTYVLGEPPLGFLCTRIFIFMKIQKHTK